MYPFFNKILVYKMNQRVYVISLNLLLINFNVNSYKPNDKTAKFSTLLHNNQSNNEHLHHLAKRQLNTPNIRYEACRTLNGDVGHCKHTTFCRIPELNNDIWKMIGQLCIIEKKSIGICCPDNYAGNSGPQFSPDEQLENDFMNNNVLRTEMRGCGITTRKFPDIITGRQAEHDEWPWMALILKKVRYNRVLCGGVLITNSHVLTAAHCFRNEEKESLIVRLGEYDYTMNNETRFRDFQIRAIVKHIDYDHINYDNDIAILSIDRPTIFNSYIWTVCLPPLGENWEGRTAIVTGWGTKSFGGPFSNVLMEVPVPIWEHEYCINSNVARIQENYLCAGELDLDSCQGDSGGPLMIQLPNRRWVVVGLVSWGIGCGAKNRPGLYTRVDKYVQWIINNSNI